MKWKEIGKKFEELAKKKLEKKFPGIKFMLEKKIQVGNHTKHRFDLVSEDGEIIAEVKSRQAKDTNDNQFKTVARRDYIYSCLLLEREKKAKHKIFFLAADEKLFDKFKDMKEDLISSKVELERLSTEDVQLNLTVKKDSNL